MYTEGDDIELMTFSELRKLLGRMALDYPHLEEETISNILEHRLAA
jgi:hypothetical protein